MNNKQITMIDVLIETHIGLERQGPGSPEMTAKALSFIGNVNEISRAADLGCGTGGQTMLLAQKIPGKIVGVDQMPVFIDILNGNAKKHNLHDRVSGIVGDITALPFEKEEFDLIWSEGVIDSIGFEKGLAHWKGFVKQGGHVAVTCPSWLTDEQPAEVAEFWKEAGSGLDTIKENVTVMERIGFDVIAAFALPESCWVDNYFNPRDLAEKAFSDKYPGNPIVEEYLESSRQEKELYSKYSQCYGYVFYIGKKVS